MILKSVCVGMCVMTMERFVRTCERKKAAAVSSGLCEERQAWKYEVNDDQKQNPASTDGRDDEK